MSEHALYYPEWGISDPLFLAESLLYWDRIACIVPNPDFRPRPKHEDGEIQKIMEEAHEQFVFPLVPTDDQKKRTHERIKAFAEHDPPEWCRPENLKPHHKQVFSAYKFAPETVELLRERGWTSKLQRNNNLDLQLIADAAADLVIGALADECGSPTMPPITDDPGSFTANVNFLLQELGSPNGIALKEHGAQRPGGSQECDFSFLLAKIPHLGLNAEKLNAKTLRRLMRARRDPEIDQQRQAFQKKVDEYLNRLRTVEEPERQVVGEQFAQELKADLALFKKELQRVGVEAIWSKEGAVAVITGAAMGVLQPGIGFAFGLAGSLFSFQKKRREAFENHWSSWIFSTTTGRLTLW